MSLAAAPIRWCAYDPMGTQGSFAQVLKDYQLAVRQLSIETTVQFYAEEQQAVRDFDQHQCDVLVASSYQTQRYNPFMGSLGAVGIANELKTIRALLTQLSHPKLRPYLRNSQYEVLGVLPIGFAYFVTEDGKRRKLSDLVNSRMGVVENEIPQIKMAKKIGAKPVEINFDNVSQKFIQKQIDIVPLPILALDIFNLHQNMHFQQYSVVNFPIVFIGLNIIARRDVMSRIQTDETRAWFSAQSPRLLKQVMRWERELPAQYWLDLPLQDYAAYEKMLVNMRKEFVRQKIYHPVFIDLMTKLRCLHTPQYFEC